MEITSITQLIMNDICKNKSDAYQVAFYDIKNVDLERQISLNLEQNNCNKFRINDFNWLKSQSLLNLPDVLILREGNRLSDEQNQLLIDLNIKVCYVSENMLSTTESFDTKIKEIQKTVYKAKTLKYFKLEKELISSIENQYSNSQYSNDELTDILIQEMLNMLKNKDEVTYQHVTNVSAYVDIFLDGMPEDKKLTDEQVTFLKRAALVHDVGKLTIPNQILKKESRLSDTEYERIKNHVSNNAYLFNNQLMSDYKDIALSHHERYDGKGYPNGLKGEEIPYFARIISVLDTFEAMTGNRKYLKNKKPLEEVLNELIRSSTLDENGHQQLDPEMVNYFIQGIMKNPEFQANFSIEEGAKSI